MRLNQVVLALRARLPIAGIMSLALMVQGCEVVGGIMLNVDPVGWCMDNYTFMEVKERKVHCEGKFMADRGDAKAQARAWDAEEKRKFNESSSGRTLNALTGALEARAGVNTSSGASAQTAANDRDITVQPVSHCVRATIGGNNTSGPGYSSLTLTNSCKEELGVFVRWAYSDGNNPKEDSTNFGALAGGSSSQTSRSIINGRGATVNLIVACPTPKQMNLTTGRVVNGGRPIPNLPCRYVAEPSAAGVSR